MTGVTRNLGMKPTLPWQCTPARAHPSPRLCLCLSERPHPFPPLRILSAIPRLLEYVAVSPSVRVRRRQSGDAAGAYHVLAEVIRSRTSLPFVSLALPFVPSALGHHRSITVRGPQPGPGDSAARRATSTVTVTQSIRALRRRDAPRVARPLRDALLERGLGWLTTVAACNRSRDDPENGRRRPRPCVLRPFFFRHDPPRAPSR